MYSWEEIHRYFPREKVAQLRMDFMEKYRSGKFSKKELMEKYRMSRKTLYNTIKRYKDATELEDFFDKPKAPKNPHRNFSSEEIALLIEIAKQDRLRLKKRRPCS